MMHTSRSIFSPALLCVALMFTGCGRLADGEPDGGDVGMNAECQAMAATCLDVQKVCTGTGDSAACSDCAEGENTADGLTCQPLVGVMLSHEFEPIELDAAMEVQPCVSWTLNNEEPLYVTTVELITDGYYHHSNWVFVPDFMYDGPDGAWDCGERDFREVEANAAGGTLFAQSTQALRELQQFPPGAAVVIPPGTRIIGATHLLNTTDAPQRTSAEMRIFTSPRSEVDVALRPLQLTFGALDIPAASDSTFTGECDFESAQQASTGTALDMDLYWVLPHTHSLGTQFRLEILGGPRDGEKLFEIEGYAAEARGKAFDPPISLSGSDGLRFTCGYHNPRDVSVGWGIGDQEMCVMLGFVRTDVSFYSTVNSSTEGDATDGVHQFSGPCEVLAGPYPDDGLDPGKAAVECPASGEQAQSDIDMCLATEDDRVCEDVQACSCGACACQVMACQRETGCTEMLECALRLGCTGTGCYAPDTCQSVIDKYGGPFDAAGNAAQRVERCTVEAGCSSQCPGEEG